MGFAKSNPTFTISNPTITKSNPRFVYVARVRRYSDSLVIYIGIKIMHYEAHIRRSWDRPRRRLLERALDNHSVPVFVGVGL
jgi:hypothetical protein